MNASGNNHWHIGLSLLPVAVFLSSCWFAGYQLNRESPLEILGFVAVASSSAWLLIRHSPLWLILAVAVAARVLLLPSTPLLSDDYFRFLWDGELWLAGYHPLDFVPVNAPEAFAKTHADLLNGMNSPQYFTVYPPLSQLVFAAAAWLGGSLGAGIVWLRVLLVLAEAAVLYLLWRMDSRQDKSAFAAYALLPLVVIELTGNLHFEGYAALGLLVSLWGFRQNLPWLSGFGLAVGIAVKLIPALAAPALFVAWLRSDYAPSGKTLNVRAAAQFSAATLLSVLLFLLPFFLSADLEGFTQSLDLYFRSFEFNGSLYVLASALGEWYKGWNWISVVGPSLSIVGAVAILTLSIFRSWQRRDLATTLLWCFGIYLLCATTVHPWYAIYLLVLAPLTRYVWPYVFGTTIWLSYLAYSTSAVEVPLWATLLEYGLGVGIVVWELRLRFARTHPAP